MHNLDLIAAQTAQAIINGTTNFKSTEVENLASKALGVLQENGVYAALLYLFSRTGKEKEIAPTLRIQLLTQTKTLAIGEPPADHAQESLKFLTNHIITDLDTLLLVKQVWEQTLIYVRYGAKARGEP
jgi:hypothetical protein